MLRDEESLSADWWVDAPSESGGEQLMLNVNTLLQTL
jgi:hypothetical protein